MIVMLDNYDSFTYNLVQYLAELGQDLRVYRNDEITVESIIEMQPSAIVLSPGPGRPENAGIMNSLIKAAAEKFPILGVCLGHQGLAQAFGGSIGYAPVLMHGKTSQITHKDSLLFKGVPSPFTATRYHSLVVEKETLPGVFDITAESSDNVIMAIQHKNLPLFGVQFHPESILTVDGKTMLKNFLGAAR